LLIEWLKQDFLRNWRQLRLSENHFTISHCAWMFAFLQWFRVTCLKLPSSFNSKSVNIILWPNKLGPDSMCREYFLLLSTKCCHNIEFEIEDMLVHSTYFLILWIPFGDEVPLILGFVSFLLHYTLCLDSFMFCWGGYLGWVWT
jgi:hypothetical protein